MAHFGIISPPVAGHLNPFGALGRELIARGHRVTCVHMPDIRGKALAEGLEFVAIGESDHPQGSLPKSLAELGRLEGGAALRFTMRAVARTSRMFCRDGPDAVTSAGIDALLVDQMEPAGGAIAERLRIPFVTVCNALALNAEATVPPPFTPWRFHDAWWARVRNLAGYAAADLATRQIRAVVNDFRRQWGLLQLRSSEASFSPRAQICQMPREFDFPRRTLPPTFAYVGPLRDAGTREVDFPWDRLDGRPLIYASLGTLQNSREPLFRTFAEACAPLDVQLVLSHGGGLTEAQSSALPGTPLVVGYSPQTRLLAQAAATLTHAGLNTVLDSLAHGVPVVAVPITYEQPAIARRVEFTGTGQSLPLRMLTVDRLRNVLQQVLRDPRFRQAAARIKDGVRTAGGTRKAADIVVAATDGAFCHS